MITINSDIFKSIDKLYHYTSLSALAGILKSGILRFGVLPRMNDITEAVKEIYLQHDNDNTNWDNISRVEEELKHIGLISLTQDGTRAGYAINSMWGHYAEKGEGCCIIFDKEGIIKECNKLGFRYGCVTYDGAAPDIIVNNNHNDIGLLESSFDENFLHKSQDWENEQEFRIVNLNTSNSISGLPTKLSSKTLNAMIGLQMIIHSIQLMFEVYELPLNIRIHRVYFICRRQFQRACKSSTGT